MKRFTQTGAPGACPRVVEPGELRPGDPVALHPDGREAARPYLEKHGS